MIILVSIITLTQCQKNNSGISANGNKSCYSLMLNDNAIGIFHLCFGEEINLYFTKNGKLDGVNIYYKNNKLLQIDTFIDGDREGITKVYWPNGHLNKHISFRNGLQHGIVIAYDSLGRELDYSIQRNGKAFYIEENKYDSLGKYEMTYFTVIPYITYQNKLPCNECPLNFEILLREDIPFEKYVLKYNIMKKSSDSNFKYPAPLKKIQCRKKDYIGTFKYEGPGDYIVYGSLDLRSDTTVGRLFDYTFKAD